MNELNARPSRGFIVALILIAVVFGYLVWPSGHPNYLAWRVRGMSNLRQIGMALIAHAEANNGRLPATLQQLSPDVIDITALPSLRFRDPDSKHDYDWLYLPRPSITSLAPDTILAASPTALPRNNSPPERIVLHRDGSVAAIPDSEFQRLVARQLQDETNNERNSLDNPTIIGTPSPNERPLQE